jgi:hypothetical protein
MSRNEDKIDYNHNRKANFLPSQLFKLSLIDHLSHSTHFQNKLKQNKEV